MRGKVFPKQKFQPQSFQNRDDSQRPKYTCYYGIQGKGISSRYFYGLSAARRFFPNNKTLLADLPKHDKLLHLHVSSPKPDVIVALATTSSHPWHYQMRQQQIERPAGRLKISLSPSTSDWTDVSQAYST